MKKNLNILRKIFVLLLSFSILSTFDSSTVLAEQKIEKNEEMTDKQYLSKLNVYWDGFSESADDYAMNNYKYFMELFENEVLKSTYSNITLEHPFLIYDSLHEKQVENYLYPISSEDKVVAVLQVCKTDSGWRAMVNQYYVDFLNEIDYIHSSNWLFIAHEGSIEAFNNKTSVFSDNSEKIISNDTPLGDKVSDVCKAFDNLVSINEIDTDLNAIMEYSPSFTSNDGKTILCNSSAYLTPQNGKPICWAACVATTYNYYYGKHITAKNVCDKINHSYTGEADTSVISGAFKKYNLDYYYSPYGLSIALIRRHLNNHKLLTADVYNQFGRHAEVITGVKVKQNEKTCLRVYDPDEDKETLTEFNNIDTVFPGGFSYRWQGTFHCYG